MNNLITIFMDYKINRLIEYGVLIYGKDSSFIREAFRGYFRVYVDNYYYGIFHTIEDGSQYSIKNLKAEYDGVVVEMLDDYGIYELQVSNEEYQQNQAIIREFKNLCPEIVPLDTLEIKEKEEIPSVVTEFIQSKEDLLKRLDSKLPKLISLVRETYQTSMKLLNYKDDYYDLSLKKFVNQPDKNYVELVPTIKVLDVYRDSMIHKVYQDSRLDLAKLECLIQKVSLLLLQKFLKHENNEKMFLEFPDSAVSRGAFRNPILDLMNNPMFQKHVVIGVNYNTYLNQKNAFLEDYQFACIQDFSHINDIYQKTDAIYKEGVFQYLIVRDCRYRDREFFLTYESDAIQVLMFEEE